jgi:hypothetical protein
MWHLCNINLTVKIDIYKYQLLYLQKYYLNVLNQYLNKEKKKKFNNYLLNLILFAFSLLFHLLSVNMNIFVGCLAVGCPAIV